MQCCISGRAGKVPLCAQQALLCVTCWNFKALLHLLQSGAAFCTLPDLAGLDAIVRSDDVSSQGPVDPRDRMKVGDVIKGR